MSTNTTPALSAAQIAAFETDGYLILPRMVPACAMPISDTTAIATGRVIRNW